MSIKIIRLELSGNPLLTPNMEINAITFHEAKNRKMELACFEQRWFLNDMKVS